MLVRVQAQHQRQGAECGRGEDSFGVLVGLVLGMVDEHDEMACEVIV